MSGQGFICPEPDGVCELCKAVAETRPYGPNGERVCLPCAMKDKEAMERGIDLYVFKRTPTSTRQ